MALLALADMPPSTEAADAIRVAFATTVPGDRWLNDAAIAAAARHDIHFLKSVVKNSGGKLASPGAEALAIVAEHYARGLPAETAPALVASLGNAAPQIAEPLLAGMSRAGPGTSRWN